MDWNVKGFLNYLFEIGLINIESVKDIVLIYNKQKNINTNDISQHLVDTNQNINEKSINPIYCSSIKERQEKMEKLIIEYLRKLDSFSISKMASDIVNKYITSIHQKRITALKNILILIKKSELLLIRQSLFFWRKKVVYSGSEKFTKRNFQNILNSKLKKEIESLVNCTFKPNIEPGKNQNYYSNERKLETFERLFNDYEKINTKKALLKIQFDKESESKTKRNKSGGNIKDFYSRLNEYDKNKLNRKERLYRDAEEVENILYTFQPNTNQNINFKRVPTPNVHERLYK